jgi:acetyl esterase/lipase
MVSPQRGRPWSRFCSGTRWFAEARPLDYALAVSDACAALPVVGKHLVPMGTVTAVGAWGSRHAPTLVSALVRNALVSPASSRVKRAEAAQLRSHLRAQTNSAAAEAVLGFVPADRAGMQWPVPDRFPPLVQAAQQRREFLYRSGVRYGTAPGQVLDVWRRQELPPGPAPVLVFVPGGGWILGGRLLQGYGLMAHLAALGWVCLSVDYRVAPQHRWPRHILDVKAAVAWAPANVDRFGGDRHFVAIAGCSAGGHLAALTGLTHDDQDFAVELGSDADTSVDAVVGIYGRYDWVDRSTPERDEFVGFLERIVVRQRLADHPETFRRASPIARVRADAPPFLVVHGTGDRVIPVAQAQAFVNTLRAASQSTVGYLELPGGGHGFDLTDRWRTRSSAMVIGLFLDEIHRRHCASLENPAI